jgi:hypothetical protein
LNCLSCCLFVCAVLLWILRHEPET